MIPAPTATCVRLLDAETARAGDAAAVSAGDTWQALMERAAGHLARGVVGLAGHGYGLRVAIVVGRGDNGGDGWALARRLADDHGARARIVAPDGFDVEVSEATQRNRERWLHSGGWATPRIEDIDDTLSWADIAVDALLGTGTRGAPRGVTAQATAGLLRAHQRGTPIVACDIPSGVSADDGSASDAAVRAHLTVTFGGVKRGLLLHPGAEHAGRVVVGDLGQHYAPPHVDWCALTPAGAAPAAPPAGGDKRARGRALVVAGAAGTAGAASLAGHAALRAGAGLVTIATPKSARIEVASRCDAGVMVRGLPSERHGGLAAEAVDALDALGMVSVAEVVLAGPGLGVEGGVRAVVDHLRGAARRLVLDADALNVYRDDAATLADHAGTLVLTPHARELARIGGGEDGDDAWRNRVERVPQLAVDLGATIVAKGPGTLVAAPDRRVWVCPIGGPELASGGTGDVLAGLVAAAVATATDEDDVPLAVARAVWWHAAAGVIAGRRSAGRAIATDLLTHLPDVFATLAEAAQPSHPVTGAAPVTPVPGALPWDGWRSPGHLDTARGTP